MQNFLHLLLKTSTKKINKFFLTGDFNVNLLNVGMNFSIILYPSNYFSNKDN